MPQLTEEFMETVYAVTMMVPAGQVASYGQIATYVISPRYARAVGRALKLLPRDRTDVPWQRIINAAGHISGRGEVQRADLQQRLLKKEGIIFEPSGRVNLRVFGWTGPGKSWVIPFDEPAPDKARIRGPGHR
jgi:methylated-DNA-protein-cysteine methyltransferase-like protein